AAEVERAESIVNDEVTKFMAWQRSRSAVPTVVALRQRFESIRRSELQRLEGKLGALPPGAGAPVEEETRLILEKRLLEPNQTTQGAARRRTAGRLYRSGQQTVPPSGRTRVRTLQAAMTLRIGTRGSELALFQADAVAAQLRAKTGLECATVVIRTSGDKLAD